MLITSLDCHFFFLLIWALETSKSGNLTSVFFCDVYIMMFEVQLEVLIFKSYNRAIFMELSLI